MTCLGKLHPFGPGSPGGPAQLMSIPPGTRKQTRPGCPSRTCPARHRHIDFVPCCLYPTRSLHIEDISGVKKVREFFNFWGMVAAHVDSSRYSLKTATVPGGTQTTCSAPHRHLNQSVRQYKQYPSFPFGTGFPSGPLCPTCLLYTSDAADE